MSSRAHWEAVYARTRPDEHSWFQAHAVLSLELILAGVPRDATIVDVGGGASTLVDGLLDAGYQDVTVLDVSATALQQARSRLGPRAELVTWIAADVLDHAFSAASVDFWHDRAVFHFLTRPADQERYVAQVRRSVRPGGGVLVSTVADNGPSRCSGLDVARYSSAQLHQAFGPDFRLLASRHEQHRTPRGALQDFVYCVCQYEPPTPRTRSRDVGVRQV